MKTCLICYGKESGKGQPAPDAEFICSNCTQKLCNATQEQIKDLYQQAVDRGLDRKAEVLKSCILEEEYNAKAGETRPNMVRERSMRSTRPARN